jgi:hypothetical protein
LAWSGLEGLMRGAAGVLVRDVAPVESSAEGVLVVDELGEYSVRELRLQFGKGRIAGLEARSGEAAFRRMLEKGEGGVDVLGEFGVWGELWYEVRWVGCV